MLPIKNIAIGVFGFGAGALTGYMVAKKILKEQYEEDVQDIQEWYQGKLTEIFGGEIEEAELVDENGEPTEMPGPPAPRTDRKVINYDRFHKPDLGALRDERLGGEDEDDSEPDEEEETAEEASAREEAEAEARSEAFIEAQRDARNKGEPYCIDADEFNEGEPEGYHSQDLYYYRQDRTICEDDDTEVEDVEEILGLDFEELLDMQTQCFVRNDKLRCIYHIYRIEGSYAREVRDIVETPKERDYRHMARVKRSLDDE